MMFKRWSHRPVIGRRRLERERSVYARTRTFLRLISSYELRSAIARLGPGYSLNAEMSGQANVSLAS